MQLFDLILEGWQVEGDQGALDWARGFVWSECETTHDDRPTYSRHVETVDGVAVWYDYAGGYYFFSDATIQEVSNG